MPLPDASNLTRHLHASPTVKAKFSNKLKILFTRGPPDRSQASHAAGKAVFDGGSRPCLDRFGGARQHPPARALRDDRLSFRIEDRAVGTRERSAAAHRVASIVVETGKKGRCEERRFDNRSGKIVSATLVDC